MIKTILKFLLWWPLISVVSAVLWGLLMIKKRRKKMKDIQEDNRNHTGPHDYKDPMEPLRNFVIGEKYEPRCLLCDDKGEQERTWIETLDFMIEVYASFATCRYMMDEWDLTRKQIGEEEMGTFSCICQFKEAGIK